MIQRYKTTWLAAGALVKLFKSWIEAADRVLSKVPPNTLKIEKQYKEQDQKKNELEEWQKQQ
jgi:hypothetical protein